MFAQIAQYLHCRQNFISQLQPVQFASFITLTDSDYDPNVKMNVFLDLLSLFTGRLIQSRVTSEAIYAPRNLPWNLLYDKSCTVSCVASEMCILILTDMLQCWMCNVTVLTATKTSSSFNTTVKVETGPLLFSHYNLMLDHPQTVLLFIYSVCSNVPDRFNVDITCLSCVDIVFRQQHLSITFHIFYLRLKTCKLHGTGVETGFICCTSVLVFQWHKHLIPVWGLWRAAKLSFTQCCTFGCIF